MAGLSYHSSRHRHFPRRQPHPFQDPIPVYSPQRREDCRLRLAGRRWHETVETKEARRVGCEKVLCAQKMTVVSVIISLRREYLVYFVATSACDVLHTIFGACTRGRRREFRWQNEMYRSTSWASKDTIARGAATSWCIYHV